MTDLFSTPATHALDRPLDSVLLRPGAGPSSDGDALTDLSIEEAFEVEDTVRIILDGGYKTIGLQFPDELLPSSVQVYRTIQRGIARSGAQIYVLADSTYGSCCPDVLSCLHLPADLLVHYGHACLTPTDALPVHYVFPRRRLDLDEAVGSLLEASEEPLEGDGKGVMVVWDVAFDHLAEEIMETFTSRCPIPISFATIHRPALTPVPSPENEKAPALRSIEQPNGVEMKDCTIWYLGEEGRGLVNLQMTHAANPIFAFSPAAHLTTPLTTTSKHLSRRLFALHQALSSDIFGLVVSNIGLASSKPLLNQLRTALRRARKKSYTMSVGRLNPAKLANFEGVECFVLVGCAEGGVVDSKDFLRPIVTPWELLLALEGEQGVWDPAKWTLDLGTVLAEAKEREARTAQRNGAEQSTTTLQNGSERDMEFSLVTGAYRTPKTFGNGDGAAELLVEGIQAMAVRNKEFSLAKLESAGSDYLVSREFKGLEPRYGMDEPAALEEGRRGIARGYEEER